MNLSEAQKIIVLVGKYLESSSKISIFFSPEIPESFLPISKKKIIEAINLLLDYSRKAGDEGGEKSLKAVLALISINYIDDEKAFATAIKNFSDSFWLKSHIGASEKLNSRIDSLYK